MGDELEVCIIEFSKNSKKIVCSEKIEYAQDLIQKKLAAAKPDEPIIIDETIDEDFSLEEYPEEKEVDKIAIDSDSQTSVEEPLEDKEKEEQRKLLSEMMSADEEAGLYDTGDILNRSGKKEDTGKEYINKSKPKDRRIGKSDQRPPKNWG